MTPELRKIMERVDRVEVKSFISLYEDAPEELNAGFFEEDGVSVVWLGSYENAGFTAISGIDAASDPETTLERIIQKLQQVGINIIGMDDHPDFDPRFDQQWFARQGFEPDSQEQIWWRPLDDIVLNDEPKGVRIENATREDETIFAEILNEGFGASSDAGLGPAFAAVIGKAGWKHYIAHVDDEPGAVAALFIADGVADFFVASTLPSARRRGAQTALINRRLFDGREAGCDIATAQSVTYNASLRNFERRGFKPVYRRTIYARQLGGNT
jgi:GNAT superfamily N-acetyltransferase